MTLTGTTESIPHPSIQSLAIPVTMPPSPAIIAEDVDHPQLPSRFFIGPMPASAVKRTVEKVKASDARQRWWLGLKRNPEDTNDDNLTPNENDVPERDALRYFLHRGGREEDWGSQESLRESVKREMLHKWRQSDWSSLRHLKKGQKQPKKWVGQSFKIGEDFLGVPIQTGRPVHRLCHASSSEPQHSEFNVPEGSSGATTWRVSSQRYNTALEALPEARSLTSASSSGLYDSVSGSLGSEVALMPPSESSAPLKSFPLLISNASSPAKSSATIQKVIADESRAPKVGVADPSLPATPLRSAMHLIRNGNDTPGIGKSVQFANIPQEQLEAAPPSEVLARSAIDAPDTSAAATEAQNPNRMNGVSGAPLRFGDLVRRERMLVRRCNSKIGAVGTYFSEVEAAKLCDLRSYDWKEFLVVWRKDQIELYDDYTIPGKEKLLGHKHLACIIPLQKPDTNISLYSFIDLTFCLTCTMLHVPKDRGRTASNLSARMHFHRTSGTDIFVFKAKTRTSGIDWMWELWRQLGNVVPDSFEVHCPVTESRVKLQMPEYDATGGERYKLFTRENVINICRTSLVHLPSWKYLIEPELEKGSDLQLCWRKGTMLDWIRWETDIDGVERGWAVIYGLCLKRPREVTHLELRVGKHRAKSFRLNDGTSLREPQAVEGYLYRIKPKSQARVQVYLSTHSGCLFSIHHSRAHPPRPPLPTKPEPKQEDHDEGAGDLSSFMDHEIQRGAQQVLQAEAFIDLRSIAAVRRAFQHKIPQFAEITSQVIEDTQVQSNAVSTSPNEEDEGGDEALSRHEDKAGLRVRRSFELLMRTGSVVRFETYSCAVAQEWVERLGSLVKYWTYRHRIDATREMEVLGPTAGRRGYLMARTGCQVAPEHPRDYDGASEMLPTFWNWCVMDGCLSVVYNGRLFLRRGLRGQYRLMEIALVTGYLLQFNIGVAGMSHHLRSRTTSLLDAYVCTGHYGTQSLPVSEFSTTQPPLPRRFQDGLESEDHELDTVFLIWYRPNSMGKTSADFSASSPPVPTLKAKNKVLVLKARSKLERDAWCWALNAEIERLARKTHDREAKGRDGGLANI